MGDLDRCANLETNDIFLLDVWIHGDGDGNGDGDGDKTDLVEAASLRICRDNMNITATRSQLQK